jgi:hypothetical protein
VTIANRLLAPCQNLSWAAAGGGAGPPDRATTPLRHPRSALGRKSPKSQWPGRNSLSGGRPPRPWPTGWFGTGFFWVCTLGGTTSTEANFYPFSIATRWTTTKRLKELWPAPSEPHELRAAPALLAGARLWSRLAPRALAGGCPLGGGANKQDHGTACEADLPTKGLTDPLAEATAAPTSACLVDNGRSTVRFSHQGKSRHPPIHPRAHSGNRDFSPH